MEEGGVHLAVHNKDPCVIPNANPFPVCYGSEFTEGKKDAVYKGDDKSDCKGHHGRQNEQPPVFSD